MVNAIATQPAPVPEAGSQVESQSQQEAPGASEFGAVLNGKLNNATPEQQDASSQDVNAPEPSLTITADGQVAAAMIAALAVQVMQPQPVQTTAPVDLAVNVQAAETETVGVSALAVDANGLAQQPAVAVQVPVQGPTPQASAVAKDDRPGMAAGAQPGITAQAAQDGLVPGVAPEQEAQVPIVTDDQTPVPPGRSEETKTSPVAIEANSRFLVARQVATDGGQQAAKTADQASGQPSSLTQVLDLSLGSARSAQNPISAIGQVDTKGGDSAMQDAASDQATPSIGLADRAVAQTGTSDVAAARPEAPARPMVDVHQRVIDQVVREVRLSRFQGHNDLVVRLSPPELGSLRVQISQDATGITSQINASSDNVKGLLQAHLPALMDAFSDAGVRMDKVTVTADASFTSLMQDSAQRNAQDQSQNQRPRFAGSGGLIGMGAINPAVAMAGRAEGAGYSWLA